MQPNFIKSLVERKKLAQAAQHISPVGVTLYIVFAIVAVLGAASFDRRLSDTLIGTWVVVWMLIGFYLLFAVKVASQWEKVIVLRLGKFQGLKGPGLFWIVPIIDTTAAWIDHRVNVTPFSAEKTLTKDTVPVDVDAVLFWVVWDAEKAALEVADYNSAIAWAAQTALRDIIGRMMLADILIGRSRVAGRDGGRDHHAPP